MLERFERNGIRYEKHGTKFFCWPIGYKGQRKQISKTEYMNALNEK